MKAGELRHLVTLQTLDVGQDDVGQPVHTFTNFADVYADVRYLSGLETVKSGAALGILRASIRIRWRPDILPTMRVLHGAVIFDIKAVQVDPTGRTYYDLVCESGVNNG